MSTKKKNAKVSRKESDSGKAGASPKTDGVSTADAAASTKSAAVVEEKKAVVAKTPMEYRLLGGTGLKVSVLSYGSYGWLEKDIDNVTAMMKFAFENGINFFDCAEGYYAGECERVVGTVWKKLGWKRSDLIFSTKIFFGDGGKGPNDTGLSRKHIIEGTLASLKRMQTDYVDLIFAHRPDPLTPIEETVRAFNYLIEKGYAFYWGTSEWSASQISDAIGIAKDLKLIPPVMEQPEYNMFCRQRVEAEYASLYKTHKLATTIWSPLGSGALSGKYSNGIPKGSAFDNPNNMLPWVRKLREGGAHVEAIFKALHALDVLAKELGTTTSVLAIAWCMKNPNVSTIISGASSPAQIEDALKSLNVVKLLTPEVMERIEKILGNKPAGEGFYGR